MYRTGSSDFTATPAPAPGGPAPVSSDPVSWATGRSRADWFALLDAAGARDWDHRALVDHLERGHPEVTGWWRQSIAVGYARHRAERAGPPDAGPVDAGSEQAGPVDAHGGAGAGTGAS